MNDPRLAVAGFVTGLLVGMTGMGGGSLMTPILIFFFNFNPSAAIGTDILHGAIFKSFGGIRHRRLGTVRARLAAWMLLGSAPASLLGVWLATYLTDRYGDSVDSVQGQVLGYTLLFGAVAFVVKALTHRGGSAASLGRLSRRDRIVAVSIGVVGGFIVGLTSVGSGTLFALAMLLAYPLAAKYVVGTDIAHAAALLFVAGLGHLVAGNVDVPAIALVAGRLDSRRADRQPGQRRAAGNGFAVRPRPGAGAERPQAPRRAVRERDRGGRPSPPASPSWPRGESASSSAARGPLWRSRRLREQSPDRAERLGRYAVVGPASALLAGHEAGDQEGLQVVADGPL